MCEEKHMGSRAVVIVCKGPDVGERRFRVPGGDGAVYTRTGRAFFADRVLEKGFLEAVRAAIGATGLWDELSTDWLALDCELLPWSMKAEELLKTQYAAVGAAATTGLSASIRALERAAGRGVPVDDLLERHQMRRSMAHAFIEAYRPHCWPVSSLADLRLAPFHLLAGEGETLLHRDHGWHMGTTGRIAKADGGLVRPT